MQGGGDEDVRRPAMRHDLHAARFSMRDAAQHLRDAADPRHVGLDDAQPAAVHQVEIGVLRRLLLARGDGRGGRRDQGSEAPQIVRRERLLEERHAGFGEGAPQIKRVVEGQWHADIEHDVNVVADRLADGGGGPRVGAGVLAERAPAEFHRTIAVIAMSFRLRNGGLEARLREVAGIGLDQCAPGAAEQAVDGEVGGLAQDVPERDIYTTNGVNEGAAAAVCGGMAVHFVP